MSDTDTDDSTDELTANISGDRGDIQYRLALAQALGDQLGGEQDAYEVFNWNKQPGVDDFYALYLRNAYARAVVDTPVNTTWRAPPSIEDQAESDDPEEELETTFETDVEDVVDEADLWHYLKRADKLAGIGEYGLLVLEFDDTSSIEDFNTEVSGASELTGLRPFSQQSVEDIKLGGPASDRWGEPQRYQLNLQDEDDEVSVDGPSEMWVHHSRVIHIPSEELLDDEIRGTPRLEPVLNNITDIEKTLGSAAEVAYRASAWGLNVNLDSEYRLEDGGEELKDHLERWYYGLEPILRTQGAEDVQSLGGEEIDPSPVIDANIEAISAQTGIPQSVLKGNETGERATSEDLKEWYGKVSERREEFVGPILVRELIDRLLELDIISEPRGEGYEVEWEPLAESDPKEVAETEKIRAQALKEWPGFIEEAMDVNQQLEYVDTGDLPAELEEPEPDEMLQPPEMSPAAPGESDSGEQGQAAQEESAEDAPPQPASADD